MEFRVDDGSILEREGRFKRKNLRLDLFAAFYTIPAESTKKPIQLSPNDILAHIALVITYSLMGLSGNVDVNGGC